MFVRRKPASYRTALAHMEVSNTTFTRVLKGLTFELYLILRGDLKVLFGHNRFHSLPGGYDHLTQSSIVSILMEALFAH